MPSFPFLQILLRMGQKIANVNAIGVVMDCHESSNSLEANNPQVIIYCVAWLIESTIEYDQWFGGLTDAEKTEVLRKVILLESNGPALSRPHADTLTGSVYANMKELRAATATAQLRIAFAFDPNRTAILLCGGQKQGVNQKRFYKKLISLADRLFARHLNNLRKG